MAEGNVGLRFIQISDPESPNGTASAATEVLLGVLTPPADDLIVNLPEGEERNSMARFFANSHDVGQQSNMQFQSDVMFRHLPWWLSMAVRGNVTAARPDASNEPLSWLWTFEPALDARNTPDETNGIDVFTIEYGDNLQAYETEYCFVTRIEISGSPNEPCTITADIVGRQKTDTTKTAALTVQTIQRAPFNLSKYFRDTSWAGLGGTPVTEVILGFSYVFDTMFTARIASDGNLYFAAVNEEPKSPLLTLTMVRGTESEVLRGFFEAKTSTYIRYQLNGDTEMDSGESNPPYFIIDGAYRVRNWPAYGQDSGTATVEVPLQGIYDSTGAKMMSLRVLNLLEAFPS